MRKRNKWMLLAALAAAMAALFLLYGLTGSNYAYVLPLRAKKLAAVVLVAFCTGYSAVLFQTLTRNRLLTPSIMGLDSLYLFVQTIIVFFFQSGTLAAMKGMRNYLLSVGVMTLFAWVLYHVLFRAGRQNVYLLVLTGVICGTFFGGISSFMQVMMDPNEFQVLQGKMFASFGRIDVGLLGISALLCALCFLRIRADHASLDVMTLGPEQAMSLGVDSAGMLRRHLMVVSILTAVSTALVGPVTFLGILLVSMSRQMGVGWRHRNLLPAAFLIGIILLAGGLFVTERLFHMETTLSVIINFCGGIYFIVRVVKEGGT